MNLPVYGVVAEFDNPTALVAAANRTREAGYTRFEAYAPFPIEALVEAIGHPRTRLPLAVFLGGLIGGLTGYLMQYFTAVLTYPLNIGGRPLHSWPAFVPVTFECTILGAALTAVLAMLARNGLPMPYHPLFHIPRFARASRDLFFLCIQARDPRFDLPAVTQFLRSLSPADVQEVPQ
ncbi:MAG TPA: DUF3341 domain-containing protein [Gemmataceae bacterium]|jgi:fructose-specific phosphotransferase system IIC component|nr:DUF3341 domain-containing protein [Gemmataceae bacterium]